MIVTWDVETRGIEGDIFKIAIYDGKKTNFFDNTDDFLLALDKLNWSGKRIYLYAHNHRFDLEKLVKDRKKKGKIKELQIDFDKSIISKDMQFVFTNWQNIYFRDSRKLIPTSLSKATKDFGCKTEKIALEDRIKELGYDNKNEFFKKVDKDNELLIEYLRNDVESLRELLLKFQEITGARIEKMLTIASVAMDVYKREYSKDFEKITKVNGKNYRLSKEKNELVRRSYKGGRVEVIKRYVDKCYSYDVNSLYPFVMRNYEYPCGNNRLYKGKDAVERFIDLTRTQDKLAIVEASVFVPECKIAPLPVSAIDKLIFPCGLFKDVWTTEELFYSMKHYDVKVKDVHRLLVWEDKCKPFVGYVDKYYKLKSEGTGAVRAVSKLLLNSLYGKFGMKEEVEEYRYLDNLGKRNATEAKRRTRILGRDVLVFSKKLFTDYIQPHIASFVTSYARLVLLDKIRELEQRGYDVYYYDTDSINTNCKPKDFSNLDNKKLGSWKFEGTRKNCYFLAPKNYGYLNEDDKEKVKSKGIYDGSFDYQEIKKIIELSKVTYEIILGKKPPTLLKQLKKDEAIDFEICKKVLTFLNEKRKPTDRFDTVAWNYEEIIDFDIEEEHITNGRQEVIDTIIYVNKKPIKTFDEYVKLVEELSKNRTEKQEVNDYSNKIEIEFYLNELEKKGNNIETEYIVDGRGNAKPIYLINDKEFTEEDLYSIIVKEV